MSVGELGTAGVAARESRGTAEAGPHRSSSAASPGEGWLGQAVAAVPPTDLILHTAILVGTWPQEKNSTP